MESVACVVCPMVPHGTDHPTCAVRGQEVNPLIMMQDGVLP